MDHSIATEDNLYEQDFCLWIKATAQQLKAGKFNQIDIPNLVEQIESMGRSEKRELKNCLIVLLMNLLKWEYQPEKRSQSWRSTIAEQRICIEGLLEDSPSLQPLILELFDNCYEKACQKAADETGIKLNFFPKESPFSIEEALKLSCFDEVKAEQ
jgi:Domain of unknown function DUF29.